MKTSFVAKMASLVISAFVTGAFASTVNINLSEEHQVIRGFGGMVHQSWQGNAGLSEADAKLAFSNGDGALGLNTLRIPVNKNSSDFGKEVAAAKLAKKYAGDDFILYATPWDSPYAGGNAHVASSNYQKYTDHLNSFAEYMKNQGAPLYAISFQNEPDWCGTWTCWTADEIYNYTKGYADQLRKHGTKVISAESFAYRKNLYDKVLNDANALKNWDIVGVHFYASSATSADNWFEYPLADQKNAERWMTEHYTESQGSGNYWRVVMNTGDQANANKLDTVRAMDIAYEIHRGLVNGNFSQYTWWYIRRCYGLIMEKDFGNKLSIPTNEIGKISKRGYLMSQYSRFVRPGFVRIGATAKPEAQIFVSAYKNSDSLVVVIVNRDMAKKNHTLDFNIPGLATTTIFTPYTTTETSNVVKGSDITATNGKFSVTMGEEGVTTLVAASAFGPPTPREPYQGKIAEIPGKVEAENYDVPGSSDRSYNDADGENKGGKYREDGVDIEAIDDGYAIGYTNAGEWLEYTVDVKTEGEYYLSLRVASGSTSSSVQVFVDGTAVTDTIKVPQTAENAWNVYKEIDAGKVILKAGKQVLKLVITGSFVNVDWMHIFSEPSQFAKVRYGASRSLKKFALFDLNGILLSYVSAYSAAEAKRNFTQSHGDFRNQVMLVRPIK